MFEVGTTHTIYERPLTQEKPEGKAKLVECLRDASQFDYPGLIVQEWMVAFEDEPEDTYRRVIAVPVD